MNSSLFLSKWGRKLGKQLLKGRNKKKNPFETNRWNIVKGDLVQVIQGPQTGQKGKVSVVIREKNRVIIDDVNMRMRNVKPLMDGTPGSKVLRACSVHYSNVMLIDPTIGEPTKISRKFLEDGTKVRVSKKTGHIIPKPDPLLNRTPRSLLMGPKDTLAKDVFQVTFADYEKYLPFIYASERASKDSI
jgi:large subunit ribosomal protein L24